MTGKRPVSASIARKIAARLEILFDSSSIATDPAFRNLSLEEHLQLSSWVAATIQELTRTKRFRPDVEWIAKKLSLPKSRIQETVDTLFRLGFIKKLKNGKWVDQVDYWYSDNFDDHPESKRANLRAVAELHKIGEKKYETLNEPEYSFSRIVVAGSVDQLERAKKLAARFRKDLLQIFSHRKKDPENVYIAQIEVFPVGDDPTTGRDD